MSNVMEVAEPTRKEAESLALTQKLAQAITQGDPAGEGKQFVSFRVEKDQYAVDIMVVREIKAWTDVTPLPNTPDYVRGVLNLRGVIVPIFDLRCRFSDVLTEPSHLHVVVIMMVHDRMMGILVDGVSDIISVQTSEILPIPDMEQREDRRFLRGLVTHGEDMVALLALDQIFDLQDIVASSEAAE